MFEHINVYMYNYTYSYVYKYIYREGQRMPVWTLQLRVGAKILPNPDLSGVGFEETSVLLPFLEWCEAYEIKTLIVSFHVIGPDLVTVSGGGFGRSHAVIHIYIYIYKHIYIYIWNISVASFQLLVARFWFPPLCRSRVAHCQRIILQAWLLQTVVIQQSKSTTHKLISNKQ